MQQLNDGDNRIGTYRDFVINSRPTKGFLEYRLLMALYYKYCTNATQDLKPYCITFFVVNLFLKNIIVMGEA